MKMQSEPAESSSVPPEVVVAAYARLRAIAGRCIASERPGHTLPPTALVHDALLRVLRTPGIRVDSPDELCALVTTVMRRVLIDHARSRAARRRRETERACTGQPRDPSADSHAVLEFNDQLERLAERRPERARIVEFHYFGGIDTHAIAQLLGRSRRTVQLELALARDELRRALRSEPSACAR